MSKEKDSQTSQNDIVDSLTTLNTFLFEHRRDVPKSEEEVEDYAITIGKLLGPVATAAMDILPALDPNPQVHWRVRTLQGDLTNAAFNPLYAKDVEKALCMRFSPDHLSARFLLPTDGGVIRFHFADHRNDFDRSTFLGYAIGNYAAELSPSNTPSEITENYDYGQFEKEFKETDDDEAVLKAVRLVDLNTDYDKVVLLIRGIENRKIEDLKLRHTIITDAIRRLVGGFFLALSDISAKQSQELGEADDN